MRGAGARRRRGGVVALTAVLLLASSATAQVSEGIKRAGAVPYTELFGRKAVRPPHAKPTRPHPAGPRPHSVRPTAGPTVAPSAAPKPATISGPDLRPILGPARTTPAAPPPSKRAPAAPPVAAPSSTSPLPSPETAPPADATALTAFIDGMVAQARASDHAAGLVVAVVEHGQVVLEKGYGLAQTGPDRRPMDPRVTLVRLGSVSKVLTWIAALKAVEAGRLKLDGAVDATLPPDLRPPAEGFRQPITLRLLMEHEAGFESREFGRLYRLDADGLTPLDSALRRDRPRRVRRPGELSSYTSYDAALAGAMVETADRLPFDAAISREVTGPLGMASTTFAQPYPPGAGARMGLPAAMPAALAGRLASGHVWTSGGLRLLPFEFTSLGPALAASSTADDMARLMLAMLGEGRTPGSGAQAWGPATAAALLGRGRGWTEGSGGLMRYDLPGGRVGYGHEGSTLGFRAKLLVAPSLDLGVFVAADSDTGARLVRRLPEAIAARAAPPAAAPPPATATRDPKRYDGLYLSTRRTYHGLEGFVDRLTRLHRVRASAGEVTVSSSSGARAFAPDDTPDAFRATDGGDARLTFTGAGARAAEFRDPGGFGAAERVGWLNRPVTLAAAAAAATLAALLTIAGPFVRGRDVRQTQAQARGSGLQIACAMLWLAAVAAFAVFAGRASDPVRLYTRWPDPWLGSASIAALLVAAGSVAQLIGLLSIWEDARRLQGWSAWRKLRHTLTVLSFLSAAFVLAAEGALEPWSS